MRPAILAVTLCAVSTVPARGGDLRCFEDAALHAVQFVDEKEGWAAGDEGVVWHTMDGGQSWERQPTGMRSSLRAIHFLNPYTGWIAGREELPHGQGSTGVLLFTRDGGLKWQRVGSNYFPGLERVQLLNNRLGFAVGDGSEQFPTGVFRTSDSGRTWHALPGPRCPGWLAADFQDDQTGALVGSWSRLAVLRNGALAAADVDVLAGRAVRAVQVIDRRAVAVGQGGLVFLSRDSAGARWGYADLHLPTEVRACMDFHGLHCRDEHIWAVGRPGSAVLYSPNRGQSWKVLRTGQVLPLNGVYFVNAQRGWAVGEFGSILCTSDGGQTWRVQQRGGQRAALLFVHAHPTGLPLETVSLLGGEEGYLATGLRIMAADPTTEAPSRAADAQRWAAAFRLAGGAAAEMLWQFPLPEHMARAGKQELLNSWSRLHAERATEELLRQLVLALRIWRPSVVITDHPDEQASTPSEALLAEALHEAFGRAADPGAFPEQITQLGLQPWEVSKVYGRWPGRSGAEVNMDLTALSPRLAATARDFATPAVELLADRVLVPPRERSYHLLDSRLAGAGNHRDLMQGIELVPGGVARRKQSGASLSPDLEKALRVRRSLEAMAETSSGTLAAPNRLLAQVGPMVGSLPDDQGAAALWGLANRYVKSGQWPLARELFLLLVSRYPAHPSAADAYRWLIQHSASSEARRRQELGQFWVRTQTTIQPSQSPDIKQAASSLGVPEKVQLPEGVRSRQLGTFGNLEQTRQWYQTSLDLGERLAAFGPLFASDPSVQFCLQAARRRLGDFEKAQEWYAHFHAEHADGPWREAAAAELWLTKRAGLPPKSVAYCSKVSSRPFLDGELNDACWQDSRPLTLRDAAGHTLQDYPTEVRLAYDKDFLYVGLRCRHPADRYVAPVKVRPHDADLRPYDRVSLLLDLDRDYSTYFKLEVDQRGCVCDDCWGDRTWDPRWYVALHSERDCWQIEAAIPLMELTGDTVTFGRTWACNVVRVLPGRGVQAWSLPAGVEPRPEGMGLLMFLQDEKPMTKP
jgi:photosystem II stability/assembly factor-like uncharacterized protein/tetratricopeptide (TPR) repeat protein